MNPTIKNLVKRAKELYPQSRQMRKAWVRQTSYLYNNHRHALQTGGFRVGSY